MAPGVASGLGFMAHGRAASGKDTRRRTAGRTAGGDANQGKASGERERRWTPSGPRRDPHLVPTRGGALLPQGRRLPDPRDGAHGRGAPRPGRRPAARSRRAARERRGRAGSGADPGTPEGHAVHEGRRPRSGSGRSVERSRPRRRRVPRRRGRDREPEGGPRRTLRRNGYPAGSGVDRYRRPGLPRRRRRPRGDGPDPAPGGTGAGRALVRALPRRRGGSHPPVGGLQGSPVVPRGVSFVRTGRCGRFRTPRGCVLVVRPAGREPAER